MARKKASRAKRRPVKPSMSDAAVKVKTGKNWSEWFAILDKAGGKKMTHKQIVAHLVKHHDVKPWWQQMVTVNYEQARGLRDKHETTSGFSISRSATVGVPAAALFKAWHDKKTRDRWLQKNARGELTIRKATPGKSMRITWHDGATHVEAMFYPKGAGRSQVTVQHSKLRNASAGAKMKKFWGDQLAKLKALLEPKKS